MVPYTVCLDLYLIGLQCSRCRVVFPSAAISIMFCPKLTLENMILEMIEFERSKGQKKSHFKLLPHHCADCNVTCNKEMECCNPKRNRKMSKGGWPTLTNFVHIVSVLSQWHFVYIRDPRPLKKQRSIRTLSMLYTGSMQCHLLSAGMDKDRVRMSCCINTLVSR